MAAGGGGSGACFGAGSGAAFPLAGGTNFAVAAAWRVVGPSNPRYEDSERKRKKKAQNVNTKEQDHRSQGKEEDLLDNAPCLPCWSGCTRPSSQ